MGGSGSRARRAYLGVAAGVTFLVLFGVFFLKYVVVLALALFVAGVSFGAGLAYRGKIDKLGVLVMANFALWLLSALIVNAVDLSDLPSIAFLFGDGRAFVAYLPLLFFTVYRAGRRDVIFASRAISWLAVGACFLFGVWLVTRTPLLSPRAAGRNFFGFLTSHTGAGTFFGSLAVFLLIGGAERRSRHLIGLGVLALLPVLGSGSRQSIVAIVAVAVWFVVRRASVKLLARSGLVAAAVIGMLPFVAGHTQQRLARMFSMELAERALETAATAKWEPGTEAEIEGTEYNILVRMLYWAYAVRRFADSPLVGMGFGRYNDTDLELIGVRGVVYMAMGGRQRFSVASAHNSYLHVAAETGVVGLVLLLWLWAAIYRRLGQGAQLTREDRACRGHYVACQALVVFTLVGALFGHALAAPTAALVPLTLVGVGVGFERRVRDPRAVPANARLANATA